MKQDLPKRLASLYSHLDDEGWHVHANTVALAMDEVGKKGRGRPPTGFNKTAYMKEYMRQRRAKEKEERNDHRTSHHGNDSDTELRGHTGNR